MPAHAPLITALGIGEISYRSNGQTHHLAVAGGFAEVLAHKVTILAETAEWPHEIDIRRADEAKNRAQKRLKGAGANVDWARAEAALARALTRLQVAQTHT